MSPPKEIKDYKIKEALTNLKQSVDFVKGKIDDIDAKFQMLVDILSEREENENGELETSSKNEAPAPVNPEAEKIGAA